MNVQDLLSGETPAVCPPSPAMSTTSTTSCSSASSAASSGSSGSDSVKRGWVAPFLLHLYQMLRRENPKVIRWAEDGLAFQILDKEVMTSQILPKYFKNKNFSSFQRQLNYFGFRKWSKARSQFPTYSREHFTRDNYSEMSLVKRQSKKSRKRKASISSADSEEQPAKKAASQATYWISSDKCKPILPAPSASLSPLTPVPTVSATPFVSNPWPVAKVASPPLSAPAINLPVISPMRKVNNGYKLPSIRELSLSSALAPTPMAPIRPRLLA